MATILWSVLWPLTALAIALLVLRIAWPYKNLLKHAAASAVASSNLIGRWFKSPSPGLYRPTWGQGSVHCQYTLYTMSHKNVPLNFCPYLCQILADFKHSFTGRLCEQFAMLNIPPHFNCVGNACYNKQTSVSICNRFHARLVDSSRNSAFWREYPNLMHSSGGLLEPWGRSLYG